jgi:hypothetical protein
VQRLLTIIQNQLEVTLIYFFKEAVAKRPQETESEVWVVDDNDLAGLILWPEIAHRLPD